MCIHTFQRQFLHWNFVTTLLSDLFGIQARGGCLCAGPYGHTLLGISDAAAVALEALLLNKNECVKLHDTHGSTVLPCMLQLHCWRYRATLS